MNKKDLYIYNNANYVYYDNNVFFKEIEHFMTNNIKISGFIVFCAFKFENYKGKYEHMTIGVSTSMSNMKALISQIQCVIEYNDIFGFMNKILNKFINSKLCLYAINNNIICNILSNQMFLQIKNTTLMIRNTSNKKKLVIDSDLFNVLYVSKETNFKMTIEKKINKSLEDVLAQDSMLNEKNILTILDKKINNIQEKHECYLYDSNILSIIHDYFNNEKRNELEKYIEFVKHIILVSKHAAACHVKFNNDVILDFFTKYSVFCFDDKNIIDNLYIMTPGGKMFNYNISRDSITSFFNDVQYTDVLARKKLFIYDTDFNNWVQV